MKKIISLILLSSICYGFTCGDTPNQFSAVDRPDASISDSSIEDANFSPDLGATDLYQSDTASQCIDYVC